jgi:hypothetical protein
MRLFGIDISVRKAADVRQETPALAQRVHRLEIALTQYAEAFATLQGAHVKLRNQFHGAKGGRPVASDVNQVPFGDKAALRRALGVVPGSRFAHKE